MSLLCVPWDQTQHIWMFQFSLFSPKTLKLPNSLESDLVSVWHHSVMMQKIAASLAPPPWCEPNIHSAWLNVQVTCSFHFTVDLWQKMMARIGSDSNVLWVTLLLPCLPYCHVCYRWFVIQLFSRMTHIKYITAVLANHSTGILLPWMQHNYHNSSFQEKSQHLNRKSTNTFLWEHYQMKIDWY